MTTCTPEYSEICKVIAPFGTTLDCGLWRGVFGTRQMTQSMDLVDKLNIIADIAHSSLSCSLYWQRHTHSKKVALMTFKQAHIHHYILDGDDENNSEFLYQYRFSREKVNFVNYATNGQIIIIAALSCLDILLYLANLRTKHVY